MGVWLYISSWAYEKTRVAHIAQSVEHILGKDEVTGSIPVVGSKRNTEERWSR